MSDMQVTNPRTGEVDFSFVPADEAAVATACRSLRAAQPEWQALGLEGRIAVLSEFIAAVACDEALYAALSADTGRMSIARVETSSLPAMLARQANDARQVIVADEERPTAFPHIGARSQLVPLGVVGVISPWNFPLLLSMIDTLPALLAGCAVALKPSEVTPRYAGPLMALASRFAPLASIFKTVLGAGETGAALIRHVDAVAFTGSVRTGRRVAEAAAAKFIPAFLEMGGKDPAIVLKSADVQQTARAILRASVAATGQACQSLERVYVDATIHDALVAALKEQAAGVEINYPRISAGHIGPFIFGRQADIVKSHLDDAVAKGARIECGGEIIDHGGKWLMPTVLTGVDHSMLVMTEETFGPVIPVMKFDRVEEGLALANDSRYGLSGSVFAGDVDEAVAVAQQLNGGAISINDGSLTAMVHEAENDCFRLSGLGRSRMGASGIARYFRKKAILINRGQPAAIADYGEPESMAGKASMAEQRLANQRP